MVRESPIHSQEFSVMDVIVLFSIIESLGVEADDDVLASVILLS